MIILIVHPDIIVLQEVKVKQNALLENIKMNHKEAIAKIVRMEPGQMQEQVRLINVQNQNAEQDGIAKMAQENLVIAEANALKEVQLLKNAIPGIILTQEQVAAALVQMVNGAGTANAENVRIIALADTDARVELRPHVTEENILLQERAVVHNVRLILIQVQDNATAVPLVEKINSRLLVQAVVQIVQIGIQNV